jgi:selenocysteine-specific elongation factor
MLEIAQSAGGRAEGTNSGRPGHPTPRTPSLRNPAKSGRKQPPLSRPDSEARPQQPLSNTARALDEFLRESGVEPPLDSEVDADDLAELREAGRAVRVTKALHYHAEVLEQIKSRVVAVAQENGGVITLAQLRDELGTSRKFAQALLEHFDSEKVTIRRGDEHVLRRRQ